MGLKEQFQKGAETIFKLAGNVPQEITYNVFTVGTDDGMGGTEDPSFEPETILKKEPVQQQSADNETKEKVKKLLKNRSVNTKKSE